LVEKEGAPSPDMKVHLFLPEGERRVLEVAPGDFDEGLLGSDFTYESLRMHMPIVVGQATLLNEPVWAIEAAPSSQTTRQISSWAVAHFYLAKNFHFLMVADYYDSEAGVTRPSVPVKRMRVESLKQIDGVRTATRITMVIGSNHGSVLTLKDARFSMASLDLDSHLFNPDQLPALGEKVRQGQMSEIMREIGK